MEIRQARLEDVEEIVRLRREAAQWLNSIGSDQWAEAGAGIDTEEFTRRVRASITAGETWVAENEKRIVGTIAIDRHTNPGLWTDHELENSLIIHRMIKDQRAPKDMGERLLDQAEAVAKKEGAKSLKLDAWTTNTPLHRYYESQGFRHVRTVQDHHTASAALFERPVDTLTSETDQEGRPMRNTP